MLFFNDYDFFLGEAILILMFLGAPLVMWFAEVPVLPILGIVGVTVALIAFVVICVRGPSLESICGSARKVRYPYHCTLSLKEANYGLLFSWILFR